MEKRMNKQVKILCVDDEKNVLRALRRLFLDDDYEIFYAVSAEEGLEILRANEEIQIVISDYRMPGMNGVDFLRKVYRNWPDTVRMVLSGYADTAAVVEAINDGQIFKFIAKPWDEEELRTTIRMGLERYFLKKKNLQLMDELKASNRKLREINESLEVFVKNNPEAALKLHDWSAFQNILSFLPMGLLGINSEGAIIHCNDTARALLGGPDAEVLGRPWPAVLPDQFHPYMEKLILQGALSDNCQIEGHKGWIKGDSISLRNQEGLLVLAFGWEGETRG
jgi:two-component system NtrC family sensor kinase